jgi:hypothetical protein
MVGEMANGMIVLTDEEVLSLWFYGAMCGNSYGANAPELSFERSKTRTGMRTDARKWIAYQRAIDSGAVVAS